MVSEFQMFALLEELERKVTLLTNIHADAKRRIKELELENEALQESVREHQTQLKQLQKKTVDTPEVFTKSKDFGKIVSDKLTGTVTNAELTKKLDEYIREIDRCIAHLSTLS